MGEQQLDIGRLLVMNDCKRARINFLLGVSGWNASGVPSITLLGTVGSKGKYVLWIGPLLK